MADEADDVIETIHELGWCEPTSEDPYKPGDIVEVTAEYAAWALKRLGVEVAGVYEVYGTSHQPCTVHMFNDDGYQSVHESGVRLVKRRSPIPPELMLSA